MKIKNESQLYSVEKHETGHFVVHRGTGAKMHDKPMDKKMAKEMAEKMHDWESKGMKEND